MTTTDFTDAVAQFITIENARAYAAQTDKWLWVVNNILDEMELPALTSLITYVEDQLDALGDVDTAKADAQDRIGNIWDAQDVQERN